MIYRISLSTNMIALLISLQTIIKHIWLNQSGMVRPEKKWAFAGMTGTISWRMYHLRKSMIEY